MRFLHGAAVLAWLLPICSGDSAAAQEPPAGVRAAGMGGAFTAVADDASATVWNPAGLAAGSYFSAVLDRNAFDGSALLVAVGTPPVGIAYYRTATGPLQNGRNALVAHHAGISLVQSIGFSGVALGATLKVVHGVTSASESADRLDADFGVMKTGALGRFGVSVRNARAVAFGTGADQVRLERQVRGGASLMVTPDLRVAVDADFTKTTTPKGRWRDAALGVEDALAARVWIRGGVHWNTASGGQGAAPIATVGTSYAVRGSLMADAQASVGSAAGARGWGVGLRFVF
ncbi:MAG TPA: hypothetical protein VL225_18070 [Vicinamibacterales bacterium]|jgi:hypothetical protein|nr:hypothetical protein [Vicinamibacterales bacterium]